MSLDALLEAVLFALAQPLTVKRLAQAVHVSPQEVERALEVLAQRLEQSGSGIQLARQGVEVELVTHGDSAEIVRAALKAEAQGELTRPSLEALAILAYRGPMTRPELEQMRGVQSSLILRNLMLRGLVEMHEEERLGQPMYQVTLEFLNYLGLSRLDRLPHYEELRVHPAIVQILEELEPPSPTETGDAAIAV